MSKKVDDNIYISFTEHEIMTLIRAVENDMNYAAGYETFKKGFMYEYLKKLDEKLIGSIAYKVLEKNKVMSFAEMLNEKEEQ